MNLFIVDDHTGFRTAARAMFEAAGWNVVGDAPGVTESLLALPGLPADVVLVDVQLDDGDGFALVEALSAELPTLRCVLVSSRRRDDLESRLATSSAVGFVEKADLTPARVRSLLA